MHPDIEVVIIDDDQEVTEALVEMLELEEFKVVAFSSPERALGYLSDECPAVVLSDVKMPKMDGLALLSKLQQCDTEIPVLLMSGHGDIPMAIEAMKQGAYDFLEKPLQPDQLFGRLQRAIEQRQLVLENRYLKSSLHQQQGIERFIIGESMAIKQIRQQVLALAAANVDTIIYGDTGSGKDVVARALHQFSSRKDKRFVAINCGGMSESLIESELFGHEAGAFTGANKRHIGKIEVANGGTLFLDEIESMSLSVQVKLLRVLQERTIERVGSSTPIPVALTVIAASKDDLGKLGDEGGFRKDLYYRLNVASLTIPPLQARPEDVLPLFHFYARKASDNYSRPMPALSPVEASRLLQYPWPGNVRELKNAADRFVLGIRETVATVWPDEHDLESISYDQQMKRYELRILEKGLNATQGQLNEAAELLNLSRKTLYRKMKKHQLDKLHFKSLESERQS
ncbi:sigma-54 dependent transcriptional regulator [Aestuariirhabdus sp. Z084]|uniref:sigma-54-dependent transcriptional regulator n=1 Tax=Aestuariirhabdus haliotis TaxID=2918751 RepID=UPI00201B453A|nr:sigma-54 dependent transcriptional regulator [Aestuariirhabdus haliotis]MCL6417433.1 sigma-54 dependent transcriptional regulator [Aestuariirhabdus haliotis]MCL6421377.1 sigma-54 dependent transcriptional regulator [Aestuariirhabdus haliotis]